MHASFSPSCRATDVQHQHVHEAASTGFAGISSLSAQAMHERQEVRAFVTVTATEGRLQFET